MTVKLLALYKKPHDVDAFTSHYENVHLPLLAKTPNLQRTVVNRVTSSPTGDLAYFQIVEMHFADKDSFSEAMKSPEAQAAADDMRSFASRLVTLLVVEEK